MTVNLDQSAAGHFGRQLRKTRLAHGWSLDELSRRTGVNPTQLSRVENGKRPPTAALAAACDVAFPERGGWFSDWYAESRTWSEVPAGLKDLSDYEDSARMLYVWQPSVIDGLLQTERYARALLATSSSATPEQVETRLASRLARQQRVLFRDSPPDALFILDELALYRCVGSADVMAEQCQHLLTMAQLPNVTLQAMPAVAHAANGSGLVIAGDAAYCEHLAGGFTYTGERFSFLTRRFDTLRGECRRVTETITLIERMYGQWKTGESPLTAMPTAVSA